MSTCCRLGVLTDHLVATRLHDSLWSMTNDLNCENPNLRHVTQDRLLLLSFHARFARQNMRPPCSVDGCDKLVRSRGLCIKHGGGKRCAHEDCDASAEGQDPFCSSHGGRSLNFHKQTSH